jgi:hypothetical protein
MSLLRQAAAQFRRQASGAQHQQQRLVGERPRELDRTYTFTAPPSIESAALLCRRPIAARACNPGTFVCAACAGNMPVKPNKYIEEWGTRREHLETEYK